MKCVSQTARGRSQKVTPCVGVWIEIYKNTKKLADNAVTPCVGVWIEISWSPIHKVHLLVTPCVGVWIEIMRELSELHSGERSLPAWECGLKW